MASGNPATVTFTPDSAGTLIVTVTFDAESVASDWGANVRARLFRTQNSVTANGEWKNLAQVRAPYALQAGFSVVAGLEVVCGLYGECSGATAVSFYNIHIQAELIKR